MGAPKVPPSSGWLAAERGLSPSIHRPCAVSAAVPVLQGAGLPAAVDGGDWTPELSQEELLAVFRGMLGEQLVFAQLLYGTACDCPKD
jgi:hypothetical protein